MVLNEIHRELKIEENNRLSAEMKPIEEMPDDPNRTYKAVKQLKRMKPKVPLLIKTENGLTANEEKQAEIIAKYFKTQFFKDAEPIPHKNPVKMQVPFTELEVKEASMKLKNGTSIFTDNVTTEMVKYGPDEVFQEIALILNEIAETGNAPEELTKGIIAPLQKPNKAKGPVSNLRPITLLSILRKILALCLCKRTNERIDKEIPIEQAAYRKGRSTTEHVFATKLVAERVMTSEKEEAHLLLLDMSKAFDTIQRKNLVLDLEEHLQPDEIHLICKMLNVKLAVKCGSFVSEYFDTDTGGPQGDGSSAKQFTFYLAKTLKIENNENQNTENTNEELALEVRVNQSTTNTNENYQLKPEKINQTKSPSNSYMPTM